MSFRSAAEQLRRAREILNMRDDAEEAAIVGAILQMRADGEALIAASRPRIRPSLREMREQCEAEYLAGDHEMIGSLRAYEWTE